LIMTWNSHPLNAILLGAFLRCAQNAVARG
jgi:hypothetical protein